ncbi:hypothetical protein CT0861_09715 [Colletotrichum tofieldiae]|uniref:Uncharacterized protein n=1 Tax=Colletotrichum tofieldiae TaxID=708197 RepID=A0A161YEG2_9PEZI|nr:hypothetical protein CT0861_09715 [Colletotrichum tofieldiae]
MRGDVIPKTSGLAIVLGQAPLVASEGGGPESRCCLLAADREDHQRGGSRSPDGLDPISGLIVLEAGCPNVDSFRKPEPSPMVPARSLSVIKAQIPAMSHLVPGRSDTLNTLPP